MTFSPPARGPILVLATLPGCKVVVSLHFDGLEALVAVLLVRGVNLASGSFLMLCDDWDPFLPGTKYHVWDNHTLYGTITSYDQTCSSWEYPGEKTEVAPPTCFQTSATGGCPSASLQYSRGWAAVGGPASLSLNPGGPTHIRTLGGVSPRASTLQGLKTEEWKQREDKHPQSENAPWP